MNIIAMKNTLYTLFLIITAALVITAFGLVFLYAPCEANLGIVQKVFYFHLSAALMMYLSFIVCAVSSVIYLARRREKWDILALSAAEIALVFAAMLMTTGPLWGRKSWGAYWTWDPRLTSALLLTLIIASYVVLRAMSRDGGPERKFAAALSIIGAALIPIIHFSVQKWRGQHPTVITSKGGGLAPEMTQVLVFSIIGFTFLFVNLLVQRVALEKNRRLAAILKQDIVSGYCKNQGDNL